MSDGTDSSAEVGTNEPLTRFLLFSGWFRLNPARVRHEAFMPHPYVELSVTRTEQLIEEGIWRNGQNVANQQKKNLYGRGDVSNSVVQKTGLRTIPAEPPPHHASIIGWPALTGVKKEDKDKQKVIALQIAAETRLVLRPNDEATLQGAG